MEKLVVDLDQMLDELEAQEALITPVACDQVFSQSASASSFTGNSADRKTHGSDSLLVLNRPHCPPHNQADLVVDDRQMRDKNTLLDSQSSSTGTTTCANDTHSALAYCSPNLMQDRCYTSDREMGRYLSPELNHESAEKMIIVPKPMDVIAGALINGRSRTPHMPVDPEPQTLPSDQLISCPESKKVLINVITAINDTEEEDKVLAKVLADVEEYEKSCGPDEDIDNHVYEDEELNRIMQGLENWGRRPADATVDTNRHAFCMDEESDEENGYDEDLANLTNGVLSHASSLRPVKEICHKIKGIESPISLITDRNESHTHRSDVNEEMSASSDGVRFADCRIDSADPNEDQIEEYLRDVHISPPPDDPGNTVSAAALRSSPIPETSDGETGERAVRPDSLELPGGVLAMAPGAASEPMDSSFEGRVRLGHHKPFWIPDEEAPVCMHCDSRFTVIKRRHHCRACGKVLCAACCNMRAKLPYMEFRETRICFVCFPLLQQTHDARVGVSAPNPSNPSDYCSPEPPGHQLVADTDQSPLTVFVPVGVLKRSDRPRGEPKQVVFSDGVRPGCDLHQESDCEVSGSSSRPAMQRLRSPPVEVRGPPLHRHRSKVVRTVITDAVGQLPAAVNSPALAAEPTLENLLTLVRGQAVTFYLAKNLHVQLKLVRLDCCVKREVWSFASKGLATVGQDEIAVILERMDDEKTIPRDVFSLITSVYDSSSKGLVHSEMSHILFPDGLFGHRDQCGFLFVRRTSQCIENVILPPPPFLLALLIQRLEVPWAKVFPLRLALRLGAEFASYPCPVVSYRQRKAVFCEVGHTILNVLADLRNFQYTIPVVQGVVIERDESHKRTTLLLPRNRYDAILKILNQNNEHVFALGGNFADGVVDSHLTCYQNEDGQYQTFVLTSDGSATPLQKGDCDKGRVGASFIVFSGALKSAAGVTAKMNVVEDGVLVQVMPSVMPEVKKALKDMKDYEIAIGKVGQESSDSVHVRWVPDDRSFNLGVISPIDGRSLAGVHSLRIHNSTDFTNKDLLIRWTEVFFLEHRDPSRRHAIDPTKVARVVGQSLCRALTMHLEELVTQGMEKIGLRVTLDPEQVGYEVGSNGQPLPALFVNELDEALIPVITGNFLSGVDALLVLELFFSIIGK